MPYNKDESVNDIKLIGIFDEYLNPEEIESANDYFGLSINNPSFPPFIPSFTTMAGFTARMSQAIFDFSSIPSTDVTVQYLPSNNDDGGKFILGTEIKYPFEVPVSLKPNLGLGEIESIKTEFSHMNVSGVATMISEFGVVLGTSKSGTTI